MPKVIYEKILGNPLLYTNMHLQLADQSIFYPEGVLEEAIVRVGQSYVPVDFVVVETGGDERAQIILGRPFLCTTKAIIYAEHAKIIFSIKDKKEKFSFKERILHSPAHPHMSYLPKEPTTPAPKKKNNRKPEEEQAQPSARKNYQDDQCSQRRKRPFTLTIISSQEG
jgi:pyruvate/2-oxoglutarate dehydrogenase complex dihydrolipoamide acyltransferase (E2) component